DRMRDMPFRGRRAEELIANLVSVGPWNVELERAKCPPVDELFPVDRRIRLKASGQDSAEGLDILLGGFRVLLGLGFQVLGLLIRSLPLCFLLLLLSFAPLLLIPLRELGFYQPAEFVSSHCPDDLADAEVLVTDRASVQILRWHGTAFLPTKPCCW